MATKDFLWSAPESVMERLAFKGRDSEWTRFVLCGVYCAVAVVFLVIFGVAAVLRGEIPYAMVIFGFAIATTLIYSGIWLSSQYHLASHFVVALMASLCLFLFHSGGTENTGPLYYFIFPVVAVFLQGIRLGSASVVALLLVSLFIQETGIFGFDRERYSFVYISRIYTIYMIVSILSFLFAWFRERAERELLLSQEDLEKITHADLLTGLANHNFMESLVQAEFNRFKRYGGRFCLIALKVDDFDQICRRYGSVYGNDILVQVAEILLRNLRSVDIPSRWYDDVLLIMLPQATLQSATLMAARLQSEIKRGLTTQSITVSMGISLCDADIDGEDAGYIISMAEQNLKLAENHEEIIARRNQGDITPEARGLSSYFNQPK